MWAPTRAAGSHVELIRARPIPAVNFRSYATQSIVAPGRGVQNDMAHFNRDRSRSNRSWQGHSRTLEVTYVA